MIPGKAREILETALKKGGEVLLTHYGYALKTKVKESISSVVTEADLAADKAILKVLQNSPEQFNIITEESGFVDHTSRYTWVVDPLDGTSNFAAGLPWFGVIIALFEENIPVLGGMYLPVDDHLYMAEKGKGALVNNKPLKTTDTSDLDTQLIAYSFDFSDEKGKTRSEMECMEKLSRRVRNIRSTNSLMDYCYTAEGRLGAAVNQASKIWDIAAPWLIIREAGGMVTDVEGNEIVFDLSTHGFERNYTIIASGAGLHTQILNILSPQ
jgi:myo-inositol-1(or 4)-monophosphatase